MGFKDGFIAALKEIFQTAFISLGIFLLIYVLLVQPHRVKGDSMLPNFYDGELLLTEKVSYYLYKPERGDVIVFRAPMTGRKVDFIKRIIGLPNENVKIENGSIFINGQKIEEKYETQETSGDINITLGEGEYFVLGDNRGASSDSRYFGSIKRSSIKGRAWVVYFPLFKNNRHGGVRVVSRVNYGIPDMFYDR